MDLAGKVALVTGGAQRVGRVTCLALARAGADIVMNYWRTEEDARRTRAEIEATGRRCVAIETDITDRAQIAAMMDAIEREFGRLDILVNNAANFNECPFFETTEEIWESSLAVNLKGPFFVSQAAARLMLKHKSGRIISMGGNSYYENWPGFIAHSIAKSGLVKLTQLLAVALSPDIQCNAVCPASIYDSEEGSHILAARSEDVMGGNRLRIGEVVIHKGNPEEVAELIVFLAGCSHYMTGAVIPIDGGKSAL